MDAQVYRSCTVVCSHFGWCSSVPDLAGGLSSGVCPLCAPGTPLGKPLLACPRSAYVFKFCLLGMGYVRRAFRIHGDTLPSDTGDLRRMQNRRRNLGDTQQRENRWRLRSCPFYAWGPRGSAILPSANITKIKKPLRSSLTFMISRAHYGSFV